MRLDQPRGLPSAVWLTGPTGETSPTGRQPVVAAPGLPSVVLLRAPSFDQFVSERKPPSEAPDEGPIGAPSPPTPPSPAPPSLAVGGGLSPGARAPSGRSWDIAPSTEPDFRARTTLFRGIWGEPPASDMFRWDANRHVYYPVPSYSVGGDGADAKYRRFVYEHHVELSNRNIFLQPYKEGGRYATGPWRFRWVSVGQEPYRVMGEGYDSFGYDGPTAEEVRRNAELAEQRRQDAIRRLVEQAETFDWAAAAQAWQEQTHPAPQASGHWEQAHPGVGTGGPLIWVED